MKRKVVQQGPSTLMVSLPSKWVKSNNILKGSELEITDKGNHLLLSQHGVKEKSRSFLCDIKSAKNIPRRSFLIPYIKGYDRIKITYSDPSVVDFVERNLFLMTGFDLVEQGKDYLILQNIASVDADKFDNANKRIFHMVSLMLKELKDDFKSGDFKDAANIVKYEWNINKLDVYCRRILHIHGFSDKKKTISYYTIIRDLECISDILRDIIRYASSSSLKKNLKVVKALDLYIDILDTCRKLIDKQEHQLVFHLKTLEVEYLKLVKTIEDCHLRAQLTAIYYPAHHISEEGVLM